MTEKSDPTAVVPRQARGVFIAEGACLQLCARDAVVRLNLRRGFRRLGQIEAQLSPVRATLDRDPCVEDGWRSVLPRSRDGNGPAAVSRRFGLGRACLAGGFEGVTVPQRAFRGRQRGVPGVAGINPVSGLGRVADRVARGRRMAVGGTLWRNRR